MASNIFINYRKDDARWNALSLYTELLKYFPKESIFKDFNNIEPGEDFVISISKALEQCNVLLVLIGNKWLDISNEKGSRLNNEDDYVRLEISTALERNIRVIPVLFDGTPMPEEKYLPDNLKKLCYKQYVTVSDIKFEADVEKLAKAIEKVLQPINKEPHNDISKGLAKPNTSENPVNIKLGRGKTAIILGLLGGVLGSIATLFIYANDPRLRNGPMGMNIVRQTEISAAIAIFLWAIVGFIAGSRRNYILASILSAFIILIIWIVVAGTYQDNIWSAVIYGMPLAGMLGVMIYWLIKKI